MMTMCYNTHTLHLFDYILPILKHLNTPHKNTSARTFSIKVIGQYSPTSSIHHQEIDSNIDVKHAKVIRRLPRQEP